MAEAFGDAETKKLISAQRGSRMKAIEGLLSGDLFGEVLPTTRPSKDPIVKTDSQGRRFQYIGPVGKEKELENDPFYWRLLTDASK